MKILFLDIETTPNVAHVWGLFKQNISLNQLMDSSYTMCFAAKWLGSDEIIFRSTHHDGPIVMINSLWYLLDKADAVVHFNGTRFDIPTCNKEFLLAGYMPPSPYHQIDIFKVAKNRFRFPSNKLDYIAKTLGIGEKVKHIGHELWVRCMANDREAWNQMKLYNIADITLLEEIYYKFLPWIKNHPNHALYTEELDRPICTNCGSHHVVKKGVTTTNTMRYQRYRCEDCGTPLRGRQAVDPPTIKENILTQDKK